MWNKKNFKANISFWPKNVITTILKFFFKERPTYNFFNGSFANV